MSFHLAGIVPLAGHPLDFKMPWHDAMMPIGPDYLAVERSIVECANAGCETIWVICDNDVQPLIRHRLGEYVQDPVWVTRHYAPRKGDHKKPIPIYYVPLNIRDKGKKDCLSWSILHGAYIANNISAKMSNWLRPDKFYVSFPYGYYGPTLVRQHRDLISTRKNFFISHDDKVISGGEYLGFTFGYDDYKKLLINFRENYSASVHKSNFSLSLEDTFDVLDIKNANIVNLMNYWNIDNWEGYCKYMTEQGHRTRRPSEHILKYHEWNEFGYDEEKEI
mgnify:FL=1